MHRGDERGQAMQIGAVLLFGALIVALSSYQAFVVPDQNEGVEFSHSQQVQNELADVRNAVVSVPGDSTSESASVTLGTRYPDRIVAMNPGPASGSLRTEGTADAGIEAGIANATAAGETGDVWNGTERTYSTGTLVYRPNYNVYGSAPTTVYENSVLYNEFDSGTVALSDQTLVDGRTISLVALNGSLSRTRTGSTSLDVRPVSASTTAVTVENETAGEPVTVRAPTRLNETTWDELLRSENVARGGYVRNVTVVDRPSSATFDTLRVTLKPDESYDLRLAKAGIGSGVTGEEEAYMTGTAGDGSSVAADGSQLVTVEVRDAYNNPVSGVTVAGEVDSTVGELDDRDATTGPDGRATFLFRATGSASGETPVPIEFSYDGPPGSGFDASDPEDVEMTVLVQSSGDGETGNASAPYTVDWRRPQADATLNVGLQGNTLDMEALAEDTSITSGNATIDGANVDFAVNNRTVATPSPDGAVTGSEGRVRTTLTAQSEGTVRVYAVSGGASDVVNVTVTNMTGQADPGHPYEDVNRDGRYQEDTDIDLTKSDVSGTYEAADGNGLVVPSSTGAITTGTVDWSADGITAGVDIDASDVTMDAGDGALDADGQRIDATSDIDLAGDSVSVSGTTVDTYQNSNGDGRVDVTATSGGLAAADLTVESSDAIALRGGSVDASGASLDNYRNTDGEGAISVTGTSGQVDVGGASLDTMNAISVTGDSVVATDATLDNYQSSNGDDEPIDIAATNGDVSASGVVVAASNDVTVEGDAVDVSGSALDNYQSSNGGGQLAITGSGPVVATDATFDSMNDIIVEGSEVDISRTSLDNYQNSNGDDRPIRVTATSGRVTGTSATIDASARIEIEGDSLALSDAAIDNYQSSSGGGDIDLSANAGDMELDGTQLDATNGAKLRAHGQSSGTLIVSDAEFRQGGNGGKLRNADGMTQEGTPAVGRVQ